ncbi:uncharacterized protein LOC131931348, partial [Physella acuta]|uniref:uncharacterized protein LOC131931348 n=1 Tax=Physella acuta TaxID=109671 RepID=UPI0027DB293B
MKDETSREIIPLFDTLKIILNQRDPEEQEFTTECLKELSSNEEASQEIISNDELTEVLNMLNNCGNSEILDNVNSIFWRSGRTSGILPTKPDKVLSDDFPKEFHIETGQRLGAGAFGSVHLVTDTQHPEEKKFVAKRLYFRDEKHMETCKKEAMILLKTKHPRIVQFHGFLKQEDAFFIFLEYLKSGTLASFVSDRGHLDEKLTRHFTIQILEGVDYLHQNNILHRDIKGCNILMENDWNIKITDFGISEINDSSGVQTEVGTVLYMAPEVIFTEGNTILHYTSRADIWSVGCTVVEMLTGRPPNSSLLPVQITFKSMKGEPLRYQLPDTTSSLVKSFLDRIFHNILSRQILNFSPVESECSLFFNGSQELRYELADYFDKNSPTKVLRYELLISGYPEDYLEPKTRRVYRTQEYGAYFLFVTIEELTVYFPWFKIRNAKKTVILRDDPQYCLKENSTDEVEIIARDLLMKDFGIDKTRKNTDIELSQDVKICMNYKFNQTTDFRCCFWDSTKEIKCYDLEENTYLSNAYRYIPYGLAGALLLILLLILSRGYVSMTFVKCNDLEKMDLLNHEIIDRVKIQGDTKQDTRQQYTIPVSRLIRKGEENWPIFGYLPIWASKCCKKSSDTINEQAEQSSDTINVQAKQSAYTINVQVEQSSATGNEQAGESSATGNEQAGESSAT